jgi:hypothetical protein
MSAGKRQILLFAIAGGLFAALMLTGVAGNVAHGNYNAIPLVCLALGTAAVLIWYNQRRTRLMFRDPSPNRLIAHYHTTVRRIPHANAAAAYLSALAAAVYGQFDRARKELVSVDWDKTSAMYQAHRLHVLAVIALLEKDDKPEALRLAAQAAATEKTEGSGGMPILHGAILVAAGEADPESIAQTQKASNRAAGVMPALCAWALAQYFERSGQLAEAAAYRDRVRAAVPHFTGI